MIKAAITGNIASGKSCAEKILVDKGFKVIDCDKINNYLLNNCEDVKNEIKTIFGENIFTKEGCILKQKLGEIIFNSPEMKKKLENILHKRILEKIEIFFEQNNKEKIIFVSVPLLFEVHWEKYFDKIIFVSAPEDLRLERLIKRNNLTVEQAIARIKSQEDESEKIKKSDYIINNNSDISLLEKEIDTVIKALIPVE